MKSLLVISPKAPAATPAPSMPIAKMTAVGAADVRSVAIAPARASKAAPAKNAKSAPPKAAGAERVKLEQVAAMMRKPGGVSLAAIAEATGWKPPTARGRISDGVSKLLSEGEGVWSRRTASGVSHYAIMKS